MGFAGLDGPSQGFRVHPTQHQNLAAFGIRGDAGQKPVGAELWREVCSFLDLLDSNAWLKSDVAHWTALVTCYIIT